MNTGATRPTVPRLVLPANAGVGVTARAHSLPTGGGSSDTALRCPMCRHASGVARCGIWADKREYVYVCSYQSKRAMAGAEEKDKLFSGYCGFTWVESRPLAVCPDCLDVLRLRELGRRYAWKFYCDSCKLYE
jgi:hypothetical protein